MRMLCISYEYPPIGGGGAIVCQGLSETLVHEGHEIDVVTSGMHNLPRYEQRNGLHIHRVPCIRRHRHYCTMPELLTQILSTYRKALELIHSRAYDLNHTHFVVPSGLVSYLLWKRTGLPYVLTAHGSDIPGYNPDRFKLPHRLIGPLWSQIIRRSVAITAPSHFLKELIHRHIDVPVEVIPNGFNPPQVCNIERQNRVLVVTRMFERKGVQYLVQALKQIKTDWEFWIAGDGPYLPALKKLADQCGVPARFLGMVPREQLMELYQSAKVFVFPSLQENFPMVLLEAMAAGCAVVTTSASGCAEVVGDAAILVELGNVKSLQDALTRLLCDEAAIRRLGNLARERVKRFAWAQVASEYEALFHRYVNKPKLSSGNVPPANLSIL